MRDRNVGYSEVSHCRSWRRPVAWIALLSVVLNPLLVLAQDSGESSNLLRAGDQVRLTVPGRPDLAAELVLDAEGHASIPQVGDVPLGGMTETEATLFIKQKLRLFYPDLDTIKIEVSRSGLTQIYVIGQVVRPGVQAFEEVPSLWDVLRLTGGPTESADLRSARVIRETDGIPRVESLDLSGVMDGRSFPRFQLRDGDTLVIPARLEGTSGVPSAEGVKVFGGVGVSSIVPIEGPMPLLDVLMLAGAPAENAEMKEISLVHEDDGVIVSSLVNLEMYLKEGNILGNPQVYPGDTVHVKVKSPGWFRANVPWVLGTVAAVVTILLGYDRLVNE